MIDGYVGIPFVYTPIEYIESSGTQYINTSYKPNTNTVLKFKINLTGNISIDYERIFDAYSGSTSAIKLQRSDTSTTWQYSINGVGANITLNQDTDYVIEASNHNIIVNGVEYTFTAQTYTSNYVLDIFRGNDRYGKFKLYYFQIYDMGELVMDFRPARYNNGNYLLNTVTQSYFANNGSGTFANGAIGEPTSIGGIARKLIKMYVGVNNVAKEIKNGYVGVNGVARLLSNLPYTPINYIQSSGTQYIDTGVYGNGIGSFEMKIRTVGGDSNSWVQYFAGDRSQSTAKVYRNSSVVYTAWQNGNANLWAYSNVDDHILEVKAPYVLVDGTEKATNYAGYKWGSNSYYIFNAHQESSLKSKMRLYYLKMWTDGTLVRNFVPALDGNNTPCLYDKVTQTFYYNKGTGTFLYG